MSTLRSLLLALAVLLPSAAAAQERWIDVEVAVQASCETAPDAATAYNFVLAPPNAVLLLADGQPTFRPLSVSIDGDVSGAGGGPALRVSKPGSYDFSSGLSAGKIQNRLVVNAKAFCERRHKILLNVEVRGPNGALPFFLRGEVIPGAAAATRLTGQTAAVRYMDEKFGADLSYYLSDAFAWYEEQARPNPRLDATYALALARLMDTADTELIPPRDARAILGAWKGGMEIPDATHLVLHYGDAGLLRFQLPESYRRAPAGRLELAEVQVGGKTLAGEPVAPPKVRNPFLDDVRRRIRKKLGDEPFEEPPVILPPPKAWLDPAPPKDPK